jgi:hypothetical protein
VFRQIASSVPQKNPFWGCLYWSYVAFRHLYYTNAAFRLVKAIDHRFGGYTKGINAKLKVLVFHMML